MSSVIPGHPAPSGPDIIPGPVPEQRNVFFSPGAFAMARANLIGLHHDFETLDMVAAIAGDHLGSRLVDPVGDHTLVYRYVRQPSGRGGVKAMTGPADWIHSAPDDASYVPASELATPLDSRPRTVTKADVLQIGRPLEISVRSFAGPLLPAFIGMLAGRGVIAEYIWDTPGWTKLRDRNFMVWSDGPHTPASPSLGLSARMMERYPKAIARVLRSAR